VVRDGSTHIANVAIFVAFFQIAVAVPQLPQLATGGCDDRASDLASYL